jgi:outer membrane receptor protein involved in Fe transport
MRAVANRATVVETVLTMLGIAAESMFPSMAMADAGEDSLSPGVLEEVTVTAQKRETRLEDTPIAVSAFTPDFIDRNRIQSLDDIALRTPSLAFVQLNKGEAYISIRGTLVNTPGAGWDDIRSRPSSTMCR